MEQLVVRREHRETRNAELGCEGSRRREALTSTQPAFKDRVAKALIDLVIVRGVRTSIERYVQAGDRACGRRKVVMQSHQEMVIAHYHACTARCPSGALAQRAGED